MLVNVTKEQVQITEQAKVHSGDFLVHKCVFSLSEDFQGLSVTACFGDIKVPLADNECYVPALEKGNCVLGVYAYREVDGETELMYSPKPTVFYVSEGSFKAESGNEDIPTAGEFESYCNQLAQIVSDRDMDFEKSENKVNVINDSTEDEKFPTAQAVKAYVEDSIAAIPQCSNGTYRLIANYTLTEDLTEAVVTKDMDNNQFSLKKIFISVWGSMHTSRSDGRAIVQFRIDNGQVYQSYVTMNVNSGMGWWAESEKIGEVNSRSIWKSIYPVSLVSSAQGLLDSNRNLASDWGYMGSVTGSSVHIGLRKLSDGETAVLKSGTRIMVFGVDDD